MSKTRNMNKNVIYGSNRFDDFNKNKCFLDQDDKCIYTKLLLLNKINNMDMFIDSNKDNKYCSLYKNKKGEKIMNLLLSNSDSIVKKNGFTSSRRINKTADDVTSLSKNVKFNCLINNEIDTNNEIENLNIEINNLIKFLDKIGLDKHPNKYLIARDFARMGYYPDIIEAKLNEHQYDDLKNSLINCLEWSPGLWDTLYITYVNYERKNLNLTKEKDLNEIEEFIEDVKFKFIPHECNYDKNIFINYKNKTINYICKINKMMSIVHADEITKLDIYKKYLEASLGLIDSKLVKNIRENNFIERTSNIYQ